jgi:hypothetical protein
MTRKLSDRRPPKPPSGNPHPLKREPATVALEYTEVRVVLEPDRALLVTERLIQELTVSDVAALRNALTRWLNTKRERDRKLSPLPDLTLEPKEPG